MAETLSHQVGVFSPILLEDVAQGVGFSFAEDAGTTIVGKVLAEHSGAGVGGDEKEFDGRLHWFVFFRRFKKRRSFFALQQSALAAVVLDEVFFVLVEGGFALLFEGFVKPIAEVFAW